MKDKILDNNFFKDLNTTNMSNELSDTIKALRDKVNEQDENIKELVNVLNTCHASLVTYGIHPIIDNAVNQLLNKHS